MPKPPLDGIDELRRATKLFTGCRETFNQRWTAEELLMLARACWASAHDIAPDEWTDAQLGAALSGKAPTWDDEGEPVLPLSD